MSDLTYDQLQIHKTHVTASQVPIILGLSPFQSAEHLAMVKLGDAKPSSNRYTQRGHDFEPVVARGCMDRFGFQTIALSEHYFKSLNSDGELPDRAFVQGTLFHEAIEHCAATPDYVAFDSHGDMWNYEIKTTRRPDGWTAGSVPEHIWVQVQWQMWILNSWGFNIENTGIGVLIQGDYEIRIVPYNPAYIYKILPTILEFQNSILRGEMPDLLVGDKPQKLKGDQIDMSLMDLITNAASHKDAANTNEAVYRETVKELTARLKGTSGALLEDGTNVIYYPEKNAEKLDVGRFAGALEAELRLLGKGSLVDKLRKECSEMTRRDPYIQIRKPK